MSRSYFLRNWMRTLFCSSMFWIAVICESLFVFATSEVPMNLDINFLELIDNSFSWNIAAYITPILVSLPYVTKFFDEKASGNYIVRITRFGEYRYACHTAVRTMLSGMMVMFFSIIMFTLMICIYGWFHHYDMFFEGGGLYGTDEYVTIYGWLLEQGMGWMIYIVHIIFLCFYGGVWACFGVLASVFVTNRRLAIVFPFLLKRLLEYIFDVSGSLYFLLPHGLTFPLSTSIKPLGGFLYLACYVLTVFIITVIGLYYGMRIYMGKRGQVNEKR